MRSSPLFRKKAFQGPNSTENAENADEAEVVQLTYFL